jgi:hypothetical protein
LEVESYGETPATIVNVMIEGRGPPGRHIRRIWGAIVATDRLIVAGDMNARSELWNPRRARRSNTGFWEGLIEPNQLVIWNSEEPTRSGPGAGNHSIIVLTLSTANVSLNWSIAGEENATGSDHEVIVCEVLGARGREPQTSKLVTG